MNEIKSEIEAKELFDQAFVIEERGEFEEALSIRKRLVVFAPAEERFILALARSYNLLGLVSKSELILRDATAQYADSELSSLQLFHFLWGCGRRLEAIDEIKRFQSISHSDDYMDIIREINEKSSA